jgi:hypothetical protein
VADRGVFCSAGNRLNSAKATIRTATGSRSSIAAGTSCKQACPHLPTSLRAQACSVRSARSKLSYHQQAVALNRVGLDAARLVETELLKHPSRRGIPVPHLRPHPRVARLARPSEHGMARLGRVTAALSGAQQLVGQLRLVGARVLVKDKAADPDDVGGDLALHRENPWP